MSGVLVVVLGVVTAGTLINARGAESPGATATRTTTHVAAPTPTPALPTGNDWTQYRFDLSGTGHNSEDTISTTSVSRLKPRWVFDAKGSPYESTPAIVDGIIYIPNAKYLDAYDLRTGARLWRFIGSEQARGAINSSVAVDAAAHLAYYGTPTAHVYAVDTLTGSERWHAVLGDPKQGAYIWSSPLLLNGTVYIGLASNNDQPCVRGAVIALDAPTGKTKWTHYTAPEDEVGGGVWSSLTADTEDHAIIATTGNPCTTSTSDYEQDAIVGIDWTTGKTLWSYTALESDTCDCDFGQGAVIYREGGKKYIVAGNKYGQMYALERTSTGVKLAWARRIAQNDSPNFGAVFEPPTYKNGAVYVAAGRFLDGSCAGAVWALSATSGDVLWKTCTARRVISPGAITGDVLFVAQHDSLDAYDSATGKVVWSASVPGEVWGGTAISHGFVVVGSVRGKLYCFTLDGA